MSCNQSTLRCKEQKIKYLPMNQCCRTAIREMVNFMLDTIEEAGFMYWADYGTLLGAVRNGQYIPHDEDADFCCMESDIPAMLKLLQTKGEGTGYVIRKGFGGTGLQIYYSKTNNNHIDIFGWFNYNGIMRRNFYVKGTDDNKGKDFPAGWINPLSEVTLEGRNIKAPHNPEQMCEYRYGDTWITPLNVTAFNKTANANASKVW